MQQSAKLTDILKSYWQKYYVLILTLPLLILLILAFTPLFTLSMLALLGALSYFPARLSRAIGFELLTLFTVAAGMIYGAAAGMFVGAAGAILSYFVKHNDVDPGIFISTLSFATIGLFSGFLSSQWFTIYGILATLFYDVVIVTLYCKLLGRNPVKAGMYTLTHILINTLLFLRLKMLLFGLLQP